MSYEPLSERWRSFGWSVREVEGHNLRSLVEAMSAIPFKRGKPSLIIADTVKSKGFSFAEDKANYHYWKATTEEIEQAEKDLAEIERRLVG